MEKLSLFSHVLEKHSETYKPGRKILEVFNVLVQVRYGEQVKRYLISSIKKIIYYLPHDLMRDLRKLGDVRKISKMGQD